MINIDDIEKIINVVDKFHFSHFEFQQENSKIVIENNEISKTVIKEPSKVETEVFDSNSEKAVKEEFKEENVEKKYIKAAFAGTFYSVKEQGDPTFVKLHDEVECDTVVGLLEVMKLFNEVESGVQGTIIDILVENGEFVEYGQPLFEIKSK